MDGQSSAWIYAASILGLIAVIPFFHQVFTKLRDLSYETLMFRGLSIRVKDRIWYCGACHVAAKVAVMRKDDVIVDEICVLSKLTYPGRSQGPRAWLQLGVGYIRDDVEGLNTVLGRSGPSIGLMAIPFQRIKPAYIRKPLSAVWGVLTLWYFIIYLLVPLFWPLLLWGPYAEVRLLSGDADVRVRERDSEAQLDRPFVLRPGFEKQLAITYRPASVYYRPLIGKMFLDSAKIAHVGEPGEWRGLRLPRNGQFIWKASDVLSIRGHGKVTRYCVKLGDSYVSLRL